MGGLNADLEEQFALLMDLSLIIPVGRTDADADGEFPKDKNV